MCTIWMGRGGRLMRRRNTRFRIRIRNSLWEWCMPRIDLLWGSCSSRLCKICIIARWRNSCNRPTTASMGCMILCASPASTVTCTKCTLTQSWLMSICRIPAFASCTGCTLNSHPQNTQRRTLCRANHLHTSYIPEWRSSNSRNAFRSWNTPNRKSHIDPDWTHGRSGSPLSGRAGIVLVMVTKSTRRNILRITMLWSWKCIVNSQYCKTDMCGMCCRGAEKNRWNRFNIQ